MAWDDATVLATEALAQPVMIEGGHRVTALTLNSTGNRLAAGFDDGDVWVIDPDGGRVLHRLSGLEDCIGAVAVTHDGSAVIAAVRDAATARMWLWDLDTGETVRRFHNKQGVVLAALGRDGEYGLTVDHGHVYRWGVHLPDGGKSFRAYELDAGTPMSSAVSSDASHVAIGSGEGHLRTFDLEAATAGVFVDCGAPVRAVGLTPDATLVLSADDDRTVRVWDTGTGDHLHALQGHTQPVQEIGVDESGSRVVTIAGDGTARLWDLTSGRSLNTIQGDVALTACAAFASGTVLLGDDDGRIYVLPKRWLLEASERVLPRPGRVAASDASVTDSSLIPGIGDRGQSAEATVLSTDEEGDEGTEDATRLPDFLGAEVLGVVIAEAAMAEARELYRNGEYRAALDALDELEGPIKSFPIYQVFRQYVADILAGCVRPKSPTSVEPEGPFKIVDAMHFFLVRDEIKEAKGLIEADRDGDAVPVLDGALQHAPYFPYANFLKALAMHNDLGQRLERGVVTSIDLRAYLEDALEHARLGATDPDVDAARALEAALRAELEALHEVGDRGDAALVKPLMERYGELMGSAEGGVGSVEAVREVAGELRRLRRDVAAARDDVAGPQARAALDQLEDRLEENVRQLAAVQEQIVNAARFQELAEELDSIREAAEKGADPADLLRRLQSLDADLRMHRQQESNQVALEAIDQLASVVGGDLSQLEEVVEAAPLAARYHQLMKGVQISSAAEARDLAKKLRSLARDVEKATKRTGPTPDSPLHELGDAIARNLAELDAIEDPDPNVAEFNALAEDFQRAMKSVEGGIKSQDQLFDFVRELAGIRGRAESLKKTMKGRDGKKAVEQLLEAIDNVVGQLA